MLEPKDIPATLLHFDCAHYLAAPVPEFVKKMRLSYAHSGPTSSIFGQRSGVIQTAPAVRKVGPTSLNEAALAAGPAYPELQHYINQPTSLRRRKLPGIQT